MLERKLKAILRKIRALNLHVEKKIIWNKQRKI